MFEKTQIESNIRVLWKILHFKNIVVISTCKAFIQISST